MAHARWSRRRVAALGRRSAPRGLRLFAAFAAASLVPVTVLGAVLTRSYHDDGVAHALDQGRAQAAVIEQMAVAPALRGADLRRGLDRHERTRLAAATDLAIFHGSVQRLRLLTFEGTVAFSDDGTTSGSLAEDPDFRRAAGGDVVAALVEVGTAGSIGIRVLEPVIPEATGRAVGVLEVVLPYDDIAEQVQRDTRAAVVRLVLGLLALYAVVALISFSTTRALRRYAVENEYQALHDALTGLPNRGLFQRTAETALELSRSRPGGALALVDLDHFKEVNDTLGHHAGDELLRVVAQRLTESLRTDDTVARLGGDEFGLLLPHVDRTAAIDLLDEVRRRLSEPITLGQTTLSLQASFGLCCFPEDGDEVEVLLQRADAAMYQGKNGRLGVVAYEPSSARPPVDTLVMQGELRRALERDELVLYYQPKIDLATGAVTGVEALVRWQHPERGLVPPSEFLPVAERSELIEPLTRWVLRRALADKTAWASLGLDWAVSVNVSARNLASLDFADEVGAMLRDAGVAPSDLCLEITETAQAFDGTVAGQVVAALAEQGVRLALDDFGVGYTGFSQLRGLAVAEIKLDRLFVAGLADNVQDQAIVSSVIELAHSLGCTVTAEGVEGLDVAAWLARAGCDAGQGYLWLRPAPWTEVVAFTAAPAAVPTAGDERPGPPPALISSGAPR